MDYQELDMKEYDSKDRLITKDDWQKYLKSKEEYSDKPLLILPETSDEDGSKYTVIEWHRYPEEKLKKDGLYIVSVKIGDRILTSALKWLKRRKFIFYDKHVTAWAEKPEPYKGAKK